MPPDAFTRPAPPHGVAPSSATASTDAPPAGWKPVEVFTKSAPPGDRGLHRRRSWAGDHSADSRITLSTTWGTAARTAGHVRGDRDGRRRRRWPTGRPPCRPPTAPWATASAASSPWPRDRFAPWGNPTTEHTGTRPPDTSAAHADHGRLHAHRGAPQGDTACGRHRATSARGGLGRQDGVVDHRRELRAR